MDQTQAETMTLAHFQQFVGKIVESNYLLGYRGDDPAELYFDEPIKVRIVPTDVNSGLLHWNCEWLDPYYDVELIEGDIGELRSIYIDGPSINTKTDEVTWPGVTVPIPVISS